MSKKELSPSQSEHRSLSVRPIENGYVVSESTSGPKGYTSTERFTAEKPSMEFTREPSPKRGHSQHKPTGAKGRAKGGNSLRAAFNHLNKRK